MMDVRSFWKVFFVGLLGGAADAIPGISGGTIYYVVGIYEEMLQNLKNCWASIGSSIVLWSVKPQISRVDS